MRKLKLNLVQTNQIFFFQTDAERMQGYAYAVLVNCISIEDEFVSAAT